MVLLVILVLLDDRDVDDARAIVVVDKLVVIGVVERKTEAVGVLLAFVKLGTGITEELMAVAVEDRNMEDDVAFAMVETVTVGTLVDKRVAWELLEELEAPVTAAEFVKVDKALVVT